jgi:trehalose 6-phosphate synthase
VTHRRGAEREQLVVLANRLPIERTDPGDSASPWRTALGGMVTALEPIVRDQQGTWIGWDRHLPGVPAEHGGIELHPIHLGRGLARNYYEGFANSSLWPLYHDFIDKAEFSPAWWRAYQDVNLRFAEQAAAVSGDRATVWVQDYQLQLVPALLRATRPQARIGFFLHIPVPTVEVFRQLPQRAEILRGLLGADLIGVQRRGDAVGLRRLFEAVLGLATRDDIVVVGDREVRVAPFASSVDVAHLTRLAEAAETREGMARYRALLRDRRRVVLAVERLDYTKGVEQRLAAYRRLLRDGRVDPAETVLVQVLPPSRQDIGAYRELGGRTATMVREINDEFERDGHPAVVYWDRSLTLDELVPLYRIADVMAVTPLRDGMNLVAKEYVASRTDLDGALVLSEHCGAADTMREAYLVNPLDGEALLGALLAALRAPRTERRRRMTALRAGLEGNDAHRWGSDYLADLAKVRAAGLAVARR